MKKILGTLVIGGLIGGAFALKGCGNESSSGGSISGDYIGLGSTWAITHDTSANTFEVQYDSDSDGTVDMTVNGDYVEYSNGFQKLTVTSATGSDAPSAGDVAYGLEVPGFAYFLQPAGGDSEPIVMVASGSCPSSNFTANWVIAKYNEPEETPDADTDAYGTATFNISGSEITVAQYRFDGGGSLGSGPETLGSCSNGVYEFGTGDDTGTMYITDNGGALVNPQNGIIFAAPQLGSTVTSTEWNGTYNGIAFTSESTIPAQVVLSGTSGTAAEFTDVAGDTVSGSTLPIASIAADGDIADGVFNATIDTGDGAQPMNCVYSSVASEELLACNGGDGAHDGDAYPTFFFLGVKQ